MKKISIALLIILLTQIGCKDDEPTINIVLPTNLELEITLDDDIEGRIEVKATAFDENYYTISFQDGENSEVVETNDGSASHTYAASGTYTIVTRAHITAADYIQRTDTVKIDREPSTNSNGIPTKGFTSPLSYDGYTLVWNEEFEGSSLNATIWNYELGTGNNGWGNNELQYYTKENTSVGDGYLTITAKKQELGGRSYTSSRLTTQGKKSFQYGRIDIRAALPKGQGMWPALWMLGDNHSSVGWPSCGEIDIMEIVGGTSNGNSDKRTHGTLHWDNNGEHASYGGSTFTSKNNFNEEFHVFSIIWNETSIKWLLDDSQFHETEITSEQMSEFRDSFFFIFNVAVGGNWPGDPDASTQFPQKMHVDYVRVFQK